MTRRKTYLTSEPPPPPPLPTRRRHERVRPLEQFEERPNGYTKEQVEEMQTQQAAALPTEVPWQWRGPPGPTDGGPKLWRGQK